MKKLVFLAALLGPIQPMVPASALAMQSRQVASFPGSTLKWLYAAEPEIRRNKLNPDTFTIVVFDWPDYVVVCLSQPNPDGIRFDGFKVKINKSDMKIIHSGWYR